MTGELPFGPDGCCLAPGGRPAPGAAHTFVGGTVAIPEPCAGAITTRVPAGVTLPLRRIAAARWKTGSATCPEACAAPGCGGDVGNVGRQHIALAHDGSPQLVPPQVQRNRGCERPHRLVGFQRLPDAVETQRGFLQKVFTILRVHALGGEHHRQPRCQHGPFVVQISPRVHAAPSLWPSGVTTGARIVRSAYRVVKKGTSKTSAGRSN